MGGLLGGPKGMLAPLQILEWGAAYPLLAPSSCRGGGGARFRILGGGGGQGAANSQQAHDTSH